VAIDYALKWVEAQVWHANIANVTTRFIYDIWQIILYWNMLVLQPTIYKGMDKYNHNFVNKTCEWESYKLGQTLVNNITFKSNYI